MKPFESFLSPYFDQYLAYRQNLGYRTDTTRSYLKTLDRYLLKTKAGWRQIQKPAYFLKLQRELDLEPITINNTFTGWRGLFSFLVRQEIINVNPLKDIPSVKQRLFIPFVFSPEKVELLLKSISSSIRKEERYFLTDLAVYVTIMLQARSAMRISEPMKMKRANYRPEEGTLYIEKTKFNKDRLIPIPKSAWTELNAYLSARKALLGSDKNAHLLVNTSGKNLTDCLIRKTFRKATIDIGIYLPRQTSKGMIFGKPDTHSLRHSFAINTLKRIRVQGKDPQHALPVLAAFMGHREYHYTAAYLKVLDSNQRQAMIEFAKAFRSRP